MILSVAITIPAICETSQRLYLRQQDMEWYAFSAWITPYWIPFRHYMAKGSPCVLVHNHEINFIQSTSMKSNVSVLFSTCNLTSTYLNYLWLGYGRILSNQYAST